MYLNDDVMVDGFTNVGSCAQIGKRVHLSTCVAIGAVVVPGSMPSADGSHAIACAVITKRVDASTRSKVRFNGMFRS